jgi:hypothetical protein
MQHHLLKAHKANVSRYRRLLDTYLTDFERQFVERRLHEEQNAIRTIIGAEPQAPEAAAA